MFGTGYASACIISLLGIKRLIVGRFLKGTEITSYVSDTTIYNANLTQELVINKLVEKYEELSDSK